MSSSEPLIGEHLVGLIGIDRQANQKVNECSCSNGVGAKCDVEGLAEELGSLRRGSRTCFFWLVALHDILGASMFRRRWIPFVPTFRQKTFKPF